MHVKNKEFFMIVRKLAITLTSAPQWISILLDLTTEPS